MLVELRLENYAVIDNVAVAFAPGLNLLTGETGAGKSILIDALALLLGEKASSDVIRAGADRAVISAVFEAEARVGNPARPTFWNRTASTSPTTVRSFFAAKLQPAAKDASSSTTSRRRWPCFVSSLRIWRPYTRKASRSFRSMVRLASRCSIPSPAVNWIPSPPRSPRGVRFALASKISSTASRTVSAWSICGHSRSARFRTPGCSRARTSSSKPRSASWPTRKKSTTPP